ncbi:MAG: hypothetical protein JNK93_01340, partial [Planctomycetia bacterium]|nr:hypothetical protein [Planctomycetia bacterium]
GTLVPPFSIPLGHEFVVSAKAGDEKATVTHLAEGKDGAREVSVKAATNLRAVLQAIGELGGGYSEAVELVRKTEAAKVLASAVAIDSTPRGIPIPQLARLAKSDSNLERANIEVTRATAGNELVPSGYDLPTDADTVRAAPVEEPALNRSPGRIFGGKKHPLEADDETPTTKADTPPDQDLARNPGRLFGK